MRIQVLVTVIGVAFLLVLVPVAIFQRRVAAAGPQLPARPAPIPESFGPGNLAPPTYIAAPIARSLTTAQVALGVFLGLWMFALSCAAVTFGLMAAAGQHWNAP